MLETYDKNQLLFHFVIRTPKEHSSFLYFILEASEGLCFYSTLESSLGKQYRDIDMKGSIEFKQETRRLLDFFARTYPTEILINQVITDE